MNVLRNYRRYEPVYGVVSVPDGCDTCAVCGECICPDEETGWNADDEICHEKCLEEEEAS